MYQPAHQDQRLSQQGYHMLLLLHLLIFEREDSQRGAYYPWSI